MFQIPFYTQVNIEIFEFDKTTFWACSVRITSQKQVIMRDVTPKAITNNKLIDK